MDLVFSLLVLPLAWLLDRLLGEPPRCHPLVIFGNYAVGIERHLRKAPGTRSQGFIALLIALVPVIPISLFTGSLAVPAYYAVALLIVYLTMAYRALCDHALEIHDALVLSDIELARTALAKIVSRDTSQLNESEISRACIESVLENGSDAIFAAWFWWLLAGIPGVLLYRLINTLDAMWGYKNKTYFYFGWAAARADDAMNYLPARTTALCYSLAGNWRSAWRCWREQGHNWKSPNAGPVMAAGAGSLGLRLGGEATYHGKTEQRPVLGLGRQSQACDILAALQLLRRAMWIWLVLAAGLAALVTGITRLAG